MAKSPWPWSLELRPGRLFVRYICLESYAQRAFIFLEKEYPRYSLTRWGRGGMCGSGEDKSHLYLFLRVADSWIIQWNSVRASWGHGQCLLHILMCMSCSQQSLLGVPTEPSVFKPFPEFWLSQWPVPSPVFWGTSMSQQQWPDLAPPHCSILQPV